MDLTARPVVGHRGNAAHAPENTLESFRQALTLGVDALEFDVRLSRDGE
ncbi:MAG: glycerophosphodiester phosphodiesterase, partial [Gemmatimonadaceae bacterium]|nr:glycerophosphodiester phosphodiesterase [Gemmatimonadaceae bacterium]